MSNHTSCFTQAKHRGYISRYDDSPSTAHADTCFVFKKSSYRRPPPFSRDNTKETNIPLNEIMPRVFGAHTSHLNELEQENAVRRDEDAFTAWWGVHTLRCIFVFCIKPDYLQVTSLVDVQFKNPTKFAPLEELHVGAKHTTAQQIPCMAWTEAKSTFLGSGA